MAKKIPNTLDIYGTVAVGVVAIVGIALVVKMVRKKVQASSGDRATDDDNVRIAMALNTAMYPGRNFISSMFTGADTDEIFRLGSEIDKFDDVAKEYRNIYNETLSIELQNVLGSEYPDFIGMLQTQTQGGKTGVTSTTDYSGLAERLFDEIDGLNWVRRDFEPFHEILRLNDNGFKAVCSEYKRLYGESLKSALDSEYGTSMLWVVDNTWDDLKEKIIKRYKSLISN